MTNQVLEEFINDNPEIDFEELSIYNVLAWDETKKELSRYPFLTKPYKDKFVRYTALWRGSRSRWSLRARNFFHY